jgi:hypothetical protein
VASLGPTSALMTGVLLGINTENQAGPVGLDHPGAGLVSSSHHDRKDFRSLFRRRGAAQPLLDQLTQVLHLGLDVVDP